MPSPRPSVSMKDVAALAGVSLGTVSIVLNSPALVSDATRSRVEKAIAKLGWVRNESARQLRAGRSRSIGMVVMDVANPFFTDIVSEPRCDVVSLRLDELAPARWQSLGGLKELMQWRPPV